jgi:FlaA1/EpsC-like NDP-sugar epimerase
MSKPFEKFFLFVADFAAINLAFLAWAWLRENLGYFSEAELRQLLINSILIFAFWFLLFVFFGLYRSWYAQSRIDELVSIGKTVSLGVFLIFIVTIEPQHDVSDPLPASRALIFSYWLLMVIAAGAGRLALRTFQRSLLEAGIGVRKALIVGCGGKGRELYDQIRKFPALGYEIVGFIDDRGLPLQEAYKACPVLGPLAEVHEIARRVIV